jgi:hypothetical protein
MKRASYLGLIVLAVLLLALGGLLVRSTAAFVPGRARRTRPAWPRNGSVPAWSRSREVELPSEGRDPKGTREDVHIGSLPLP